MDPLPDGGAPSFLYNVTASGVGEDFQASFIWIHAITITRYLPLYNKYI
jgi:hypothetical protein